MRPATHSGDPSDPRGLLMPALTHEQERRHRQACQLVNLSRDLQQEEREFVLDYYRASTTGRSRSDRAHFTPRGLAIDMSTEVIGNRVVDLAAGIGRLAYHNTNTWPCDSRELVCVERNEEFVRVGRRVVPEARWICADIMTIPDMLDDLGTFDTAISNPPYGAIDRLIQATLGYRGRRFEYHTIGLASMIARHGVFLIPQRSASFQFSGPAGKFVPGTGDDEYDKFVAATGIELDHNCGIDTDHYRGSWHDVNVLVEVVTVDFADRAVPAPRAAAAPRPSAAAVAAAAEQLSFLGF
ncbi:hypothetical protein AB0A63_13765 [Lentzea sp. NPDC042327]|uniref:hypothetical protein n=1 Tax=Lentzea sp. NPDC042327 TaxID=3154801 RepID=UPI0033FFF512